METTYNAPPPGWEGPQHTAKHYPASDKATLPATLSTKVVGLSFHPGYPCVVHHLNTEGCAGLVLVRDHDNPHDADAVAVALIDVTDGPLGHVPAALAARLAHELDRHGEWAVVSWDVLVSSGYTDRPGLTVRLERRRPADG